MSDFTERVSDAVEAGARALNDHDTWLGIEDGAECECGLLLAVGVETYAHPIWKTHRAREATRAMWPILSAGLRAKAEVHAIGAHVRGSEEERHWLDLIHLIDRIDKELGL